MPSANPDSNGASAAEKAAAQRVKGDADRARAAEQAAAAERQRQEADSRARSTIPAPGPAPRSEFEPFMRGTSNTQYQQAYAIVENFMSIMGWPVGVKGEELIRSLLATGGTELSPERAYNYLFSLLPEKIQRANPNAEFGLTQDIYIQQLNNLKDSFSYFTGSPDIPQDVLRMAIDQQWTQSEMMQFLKNDSRYTDPNAMPWLKAGQGYRDASNQFYQSYGRAPTGQAQLANWFSFKTGAAGLAGGAPATQVALPPAGSQTRPPGLGTGQSEIR